MEVDDDVLTEARLDEILSLLRAKDAMKACADGNFEIQLLDLITHEIESRDADRLAIGDRLDGAKEGEGRRQGQQCQIEGN
jgi:hypothetical protein